jgi:hypothetical protein
VFTGGAPPDTSTQTVGGYINQVIKTGTYPAYNQLQLGVGSTTLYNQGRFETGGVTPSRSFSYYLGLSDYDQSFRYGSQNNSAPSNVVVPDFNGYTNFTYYGLGPIPYCSPTGAAPTAAAGCNVLFPFNSGGLQRTYDQEGVVNLHFGIPNKNGTHDDIQLLGSVSHLTDKYYTSIDDYAGAVQNTFATLNSEYGIGAYTPPTYLDGVEFPVGTKPLQPVSSIPTNVNCFSGGAAVQYVPYLFPSSPSGRPCDSPIPAGQEDGVQVDTGITKVQYQHAFNQNAFLRVYGYTDYSDWLQSAPYFADAGYGGYFGGFYTEQASPDYELITHTRGLSANLVDQINSKNLLELSANFTTATPIRFNNSTWDNTPGSNATNLVSVAPNGTYTCWGPTGAPTSCYENRGQFGNPTPFAATGAAAAAGAQWLVTKVGPTGTYNTVIPDFYSYALTDQMNVSEKLLLNFGVRLEQYDYNLVPLTGGIYNFWYQAADSSLCYNPTDNEPVSAPLPKGAAPPAAPFVGLTCPMENGVQTLHPNGQNGALLYTGQIAGNIARTAFEPRISSTYTVDPNDVIRASFGKYSQPVQTAYVEYNNLDPSSLTSAGGAGANFNLFLPYGFTTPEHNLPPATSYNSDLSFEHQFKNTDWSIAVSPFYRRTLNQYETISIGPNFASAYPAVNQNSFGYEVALRKGDPSREGWSGQLSYTYTKTGVQFPNLPTGTNAIDNINYYINSFNALTSAGTIPTTGAPKVTGSPCYLAGVTYAGCTVTGHTITMSPAGLAAGAVVNPYYFMAEQPLLDKNATYPSFDSFPAGPVSSGDTLSPPQIITGFVNYRHRKFSVTPSFQLAQPGYYGDPLSVVGVDPRACPGGAGSNQAGIATAPNPGLPNYLACEVPSSFINGGLLAIPDPETGKFDGFGSFVDPWVLGVNLQLGYDISPRVHLNVLVANLLTRCFGGSVEPWSSGATAPSQAVCGYGAGYYVSNFYNGASPMDIAANGAAALPWQQHAYAPFAQPFQPLNIYFQLQVKL